MPAPFSNFCDCSPSTSLRVSQKGSVQIKSIARRYANDRLGSLDSSSTMVHPAYLCPTCISIDTGNTCKLYVLVALMVVVRKQDQINSSQYPSCLALSSTTDPRCRILVNITSHPNILTSTCPCIFLQAIKLYSCPRLKLVYLPRRLSPVHP